MNDRIPLPALPRELGTIAGGKTKPYSVCYKAAVDARIPVLQGDNGRYFVERSKLSEIALALGLTVTKQAAPLAA